jgi:tricorn protease
MKYLLSSITKLFFAVICILSSDSVIAQGTMLLRQPTASKDHIAFVYGNDLWVVGREGGDARRLTSAVDAESSLKLSPHGQWIAFTGQYPGNTDVYIVPIGGGDPKRLTWHPLPDIVQGWTADGGSEGRDLQLEKAAQEALPLLLTDGIELKKEPAPPIRYRRPGKK